MLRSLITIGHLIGMTEEEMQKAYFENMKKIMLVKQIKKRGM